MLQKSGGAAAAAGAVEVQELLPYAVDLAEWMTGLGPLGGGIAAQSHRPGGDGVRRARIVRIEIENGRGGSCTVKVVDAAVTAGTTPVGIVITPNGASAYTTNNGSLTRIAGVGYLLCTGSERPGRPGLRLGAITVAGLRDILADLPDDVVLVVCEGRGRRRLFTLADVEEIWYLPGAGESTPLGRDGDGDVHEPGSRDLYAVLLHPTRGVACP